MTEADVEQQIKAVSHALTHAARRTGHPDTANRLVEPLRIVWADLDALPRTDVFWSRQPNHQATVHKLATDAHERVAADPGDRQARRALVAIALLQGSHDAGPEHLTVELTEVPAAVGDAGAFARWVWLQTGSATTPYLRTARASADQAAVTALARDTHGWTTLAAQIALDVLGGLTVQEAYERHTPPTPSR